MSQGESGRWAQKARTRTAIVEAARRLASRGDLPKVAQAADEAGVSRATAYRYFPTQEALEVELEISAVWTGMETLLAGLKVKDPAARLDLIAGEVVKTVGHNEEHVRTALRVIQDTWLRRGRGADAPVRRARRMKWIDTALATATELPPDVHARLRAALAVVVSPDAVIQLHDALGLTAAGAAEVLGWSARAMVSAALNEAADRPKTVVAAGPASARTRASASRRRG
jgi:AcrR family transcriptional regulator